MEPSKVLVYDSRQNPRRPATLSVRIKSRRLPFQMAAKNIYLSAVPDLCEWSAHPRALI